MADLSGGEEDHSQADQPSYRVGDGSSLQLNVQISASEIMRDTEELEPKPKKRRKLNQSEESVVPIDE